MKHGNDKINGMADGGTVRICDVPAEIPIGEVLRKADQIAFGQAAATPSSSRTTVAWDRIKGATPGVIVL